MLLSQDDTVYWGGGCKNFHHLWQQQNHKRNENFPLISRLMCHSVTKHVNGTVPQYLVMYGAFWTGEEKCVARCYWANNWMHRNGINAMLRKWENNIILMPLDDWKSLQQQRGVKNMLWFEVQIFINMRIHRRVTNSVNTNQDLGVVYFGFLFGKAGEVLILGIVFCEQFSSCIFHSIQAGAISSCANCRAPGPIPGNRSRGPIHGRVGLQHFAGFSKRLEPTEQEGQGLIQGGGYNT